MSRLKCIWCAKIHQPLRRRGKLGTIDFSTCPKHPRPLTVLPVEPVDGKAVRLGGSYCHEYMPWPWWMPAWVWIRGTVLWPFFDNEILVRAGKIMTQQLQEKYDNEQGSETTER